MAAVIITIIELAISVGIVVAACVFMAFARFMPYVTGLYCVFATAVYAALTAFFLITNISRYDLDDYDFEELGVMTRIITGIIYTASAYFVIAMPAEILWKKYFETVGTTGGFGTAYLLIRMALFITAGLVVTISIIRDKDTIDVLA